MTLSLKARKRWSLVILLIGMPLYVLVAWGAMGWLFPDPENRPHVLIELAIYVGLGILWALPFRFIFKGVGRAE